MIKKLKFLKLILKIKKKSKLLRKYKNRKNKSY